MLGDHFGLRKHDIKGIDFVIIGYTHCSSGLKIIHINSDNDNFLLLFDKNRPDLLGSIGFVMPYFAKNKILTTLHFAKLGVFPCGSFDGIDDFAFTCAPGKTLHLGVGAQAYGFRDFGHGLLPVWFFTRSIPYSLTTVNAKPVNYRTEYSSSIGIEPEALSIQYGLAGLIGVDTPGIFFALAALICLVAPLLFVKQNEGKESLKENHPLRPEDINSFIKDMDFMHMLGHLYDIQLQDAMQIAGNLASQKDKDEIENKVYILTAFWREARKSNDFKKTKDANHQTILFLREVLDKKEKIGLEIKAKGFVPEDRMHERIKHNCSLLEEEIIRLESLAPVFDDLDIGKKPVIEKIDFPVYIDLLLKLMFATCDKRITIQKEFPSTFPVVLVNRTAIVYLFLNLLFNAKVFTRDLIRIRAGEEMLDGKPYIRVDIEDNGPGIALEHLEKIFEDGFTTRKGGTGLGLPCVRRLVRAMGGNITVESTPGAGATFTVHIPVEEEPRQNTDSAANAILSTGTEGMALNASLIIAVLVALLFVFLAAVRQDDDKEGKWDYEREVEVMDPYGLHARPCSAVVCKAVRFLCEIELLNLDSKQKANAKSMLLVMALAAEEGHKVKVRTRRGNDSKEALEAISEIIGTVFDFKKDPPKGTSLKMVMAWPEIFSTLSPEIVLMALSAVLVMLPAILEVFSKVLYGLGWDSFVQGIAPSLGTMAIQSLIGAMAVLSVSMVVSLFARLKFKKDWEIPTVGIIFTIALASIAYSGFGGLLVALGTALGMLIGYFESLKRKNIIRSASFFKNRPLWGTLIYSLFMMMAVHHFTRISDAWWGFAIMGIVALSMGASRTRPYLTQDTSGEKEAIENIREALKQDIEGPTVYEIAKEIQQGSRGEQVLTTVQRLYALVDDFILITPQEAIHEGFARLVQRRFELDFYESPKLAMIETHINNIVLIRKYYFIELARRMDTTELNSFEDLSRAFNAQGYQTKHTEEQKIIADTIRRINEYESDVIVLGAANIFEGIMAAPKATLCHRLFAKNTNLAMVRAGELTLVRKTALVCLLGLMDAQELLSFEDLAQGFRLAGYETRNLFAPFKKTCIEPMALRAQKLAEQWPAIIRDYRAILSLMAEYLHNVADDQALSERTKTRDKEDQVYRLRTLSVDIDRPNPTETFLLIHYFVDTSLDALGAFIQDEDKQLSHMAASAKAVISQLQPERQTVMDRRLVDIDNIMDQAVQLIKHRYMVRHIRLARVVQNKAPPVIASHSSLLRVFLNLFIISSNHFKFAGPWPILRIETTYDSQDQDLLIEFKACAQDMMKSRSGDVSLVRQMIENQGGIFEVDHLPKETTFMIGLRAQKPSLENFKVHNILLFMSAVSINDLNTLISKWIPIFITVMMISFLVSKILRQKVVKIFLNRVGNDYNNGKATKQPIRSPDRAHLKEHSYLSVAGGGTLCPVWRPSSLIKFLSVVPVFLNTFNRGNRDFDFHNFISRSAEMVCRLFSRNSVEVGIPASTIPSEGSRVRPFLWVWRLLYSAINLLWAGASTFLKFLSRSNKLGTSFARKSSVSPINFRGDRLPIGAKDVPNLHEEESSYPMGQHSSSNRWIVGAAFILAFFVFDPSLYAQNTNDISSTCGILSSARHIFSDHGKTQDGRLKLRSNGENLDETVNEISAKYPIPCLFLSVCNPEGGSLGQVNIKAIYGNSNVLNCPLGFLLDPFVPMIDFEPIYYYVADKWYIIFPSGEVIELGVAIKRGLLNQANENKDTISGSSSQNCLAPSDMQLIAVCLLIGWALVTAHYFRHLHAPQEAVKTPTQKFFRFIRHIAFWWAAISIMADLLQAQGALAGSELTRHEQLINIQDVVKLFSLLMLNVVGVMLLLQKMKSIGALKAVIFITMLVIDFIALHGGIAVPKGDMTSTLIGVAACVVITIIIFVISCYSAKRIANTMHKSDDKSMDDSDHLMLDPERIFNQHPNFVEAVQYFNEKVIGQNENGDIRPILWPQIVDLIELYRGDRHNPEYTDSDQREQRLTLGKGEFFYKTLIFELLKLTNAICITPKKVLENAVEIYLFTIYHRVLVGQEGFKLIGEGGDQQHVYSTAEGHHRLGWFLMNFFLIRNGYLLFYFRDRLEYFSLDLANQSKLEENRTKLTDLIKNRVIEREKIDPSEDSEQVNGIIPGLEFLSLQAADPMTLIAIFAGLGLMTVVQARRKNAVLIGRQIKKYRKASGLTQEVLAWRAHISLAAIGYLENGKHRPALRTLVKLSRALDIKPSFIWVGCSLAEAMAMPRYKTRGQRLRLAREVRGLSQEELAKRLCKSSREIRTMVRKIISWEYDERAPSPQEFVELCEELQIEPCLILEGYPLLEALARSASIGKRIRMLRIINGLKQKDVSRILNKYAAFQSFNELELNKYTPSAKKIVELARILKVKPSLILTGYSLGEALDHTNGHVGQRIEILRTVHGYSQSKFARIIGVSPTTMCRMEKARYPSNVLLVYQIERFFRFQIGILTLRTLSRIAHTIQYREAIRYKTLKWTKTPKPGSQKARFNIILLYVDSWAMAVFLVAVLVGSMPYIVCKIKVAKSGTSFIRNLSLSLRRAYGDTLGIRMKDVPNYQRYAIRYPLSAIFERLAFSVERIGKNDPSAIRYPLKKFQEENPYEFIPVEKGKDDRHVWILYRVEEKETAEPMTGDSTIRAPDHLYRSLYRRYGLFTFLLSTFILLISLSALNTLLPGLHHINVFGPAFVPLVGLMKDSSDKGGRPDYKKKKRKTKGPKSPELEMDVVFQHIEESGFGHDTKLQEAVQKAVALVQAAQGAWQDLKARNALGNRQLSLSEKNIKEPLDEFHRRLSAVKGRLQVLREMKSAASKENDIPQKQKESDKKQPVQEKREKPAVRPQKASKRWFIIGVIVIALLAIAAFILTHQSASGHPLILAMAFLPLAGRVKAVNGCKVSDQKTGRRESLNEYHRMYWYKSEEFMKLERNLKTEITTQEASKNRHLVSIFISPSRKKYLLFRQLLAKTTYIVSSEFNRDLNGYILIFTAKGKKHVIIYELIGEPPDGENIVPILANGETLDEARSDLSLKRSSNIRWSKGHEVFKNYLETCTRPGLRSAKKSRAKKEAYKAVIPKPNQRVIFKCLVEDAWYWISLHHVEELQKDVFLFTSENEEDYILYPIPSRPSKGKPREVYPLSRGRTLLEAKGRLIFEKFYRMKWGQAEGFEPGADFMRVFLVSTKSKNKKGGKIRISPRKNRHLIFGHLLADTIYEIWFEFNEDLMRYVLIFSAVGKRHVVIYDTVGVPKTKDKHCPTLASGQTLKEAKEKLQKKIEEIPERQAMVRFLSQYRNGLNHAGSLCVRLPAPSSENLYVAGVNFGELKPLTFYDISSELFKPMCPRVVVFESEYRDDYVIYGLVHDPKGGRAPVLGHASTLGKAKDLCLYKLFINDALVHTANENRLKKFGDLLGQNPQYIQNDNFIKLIQEMKKPNAAAVGFVIRLLTSLIDECVEEFYELRPTTHQGLMEKLAKNTLIRYTLLYRKQEHGPFYPYIRQALYKNMYVELLQSESLTREYSKTFGWRPSDPSGDFHAKEVLLNIIRRTDRLEPEQKRVLVGWLSALGEVDLAGFVLSYDVLDIIGEELRKENQIRKERYHSLKRQKRADKSKEEVTLSCALLSGAEMLGDIAHLLAGLSLPAVFGLVQLRDSPLRPIRLANAEYITGPVYQPRVLLMGPDLCGQGCIHCLQAESFCAYLTRNIPKVLSMLKDADQLGVHRLSFCIGETFYHKPFIFGVLGGVRASRYLTVRNIITNCAFADSSQNAEDILRQTKRAMGNRMVQGATNFIVSWDKGHREAGITVDCIMNFIWAERKTFPEHQKVLVQLTNFKNDDSLLILMETLKAQALIDQPQPVKTDGSITKIELSNGCLLLIRFMPMTVAGNAQKLISQRDYSPVYITKSLFYFAEYPVACHGDVRPAKQGEISPKIKDFGRKGESRTLRSSNMKR
ncbi:MAG: HPr family phosphocarrier protein, partial [Candidatus Omnitrophota bacterium]